MVRSRAACCAAVLIGFACVGCQAAADLGDQSVYNLTLDYRDGDDFLMAWQSLWQNGAEKCMNDNTLETVSFKIEGVPSPRPVGWQNGALSDRKSCKELVDGYPYHG